MPVVEVRRPELLDRSRERGEALPGRDAVRERTLREVKAEWAAAQGDPKALARARDAFDAERPHPSFSELAEATVARAFVDVVVHLDQLDPGVPPHHPSLRPMRKELLKLRDLLDMFAHAYGRGANELRWTKLRGRVDEGYELLGHYKDLWESQGLRLVKGDARGSAAVGKPVRAADIPYDAKQVAALQKRFAAWRESFLESERVQRFNGLVGAPASKPVKMDKRRLTRFFWGGVDFSPKKGRSGISNLRRLADGLLMKALEDYQDVKALDAPIGEKEERAFHDFRKRLRAVWNLLQYFPNVYAHPEMANEFDPQLRLVVNKLGEVEDKLVALRLAQERGDKKEIRQREAEVLAQWEELKRWRKTAQVGHLLQDLLAHLG